MNGQLAACYSVARAAASAVTSHRRPQEHSSTFKADRKTESLLYSDYITIYYTFIKEWLYYPLTMKNDF